MSKNPQQGGLGFLSAFLISALATVGVTAAGLSIGVGAGVVVDKINGPTMPEIDMGTKAEEKRAETIGSTFGPTIRVENGVVTWKIEDEKSNSQEEDSGNKESEKAIAPPSKSQKQQENAEKEQVNAPAVKDNTPKPSLADTGSPEVGNNNPSSGKTQAVKKNNENSDSGRTIYITPTGKRYHYDNSCNGGTYIESTLEEANRLGLTPCNKCVN